MMTARANLRKLNYINDMQGLGACRNQFLLKASTQAAASVVTSAAAQPELTGGTGMVLHLSWPVAHAHAVSMRHLSCSSEWVAMHAAF